MSTDSYTRSSVNKDSRLFFHHLWTSSLGAFFLCMILPFIATLASEGPRIPGLYHRDLDDSNLLVHFANASGLWPLFTVLFAAGFPTVSIIWACHRYRPYFTNLASVKYYAGLLIAGGYSIVFWMFWTPWSNPDQLEGMAWSLALAVVYPGLNLLMIGILVVLYSAADDAAAGKNQINGGAANRLSVLSRAETQSKRGYVWVFDADSKPIGIWVPISLLNSDNRDSSLKMAISMEKVSIERAGGNADLAGFDLDLFIAFAEREYRIVPVENLEVANNVRFKNGAFLMLGPGKAPSEAANPVEAWEVRKNLGQPNLVPIRS